MVQNVVVQGAGIENGGKNTGARVVVVRRVVGAGVGLGVVGVVVGGQGIWNGASVPQGMERCQVPRSSAGFLGLGRELDRELGRGFSGTGSLRRGERCECGDDRDGEFHDWCV